MRPPFKLQGRHAAARVFRDGKQLPGFSGYASGRASYVWTWYVLVPLASEAADSVEFRMGPGEHPWHRITATPEEALAELEKGRPWTSAIIKKVEVAREARRARLEA